MYNDNDIGYHSNQDKPSLQTAITIKTHYLRKVACNSQVLINLLPSKSSQMMTPVDFWWQRKLVCPWENPSIRLRSSERCLWWPIGQPDTPQSAERAIHDSHSSSYQTCSTWLDLIHNWLCLRDRICKLTLALQSRYNHEWHHLSSHQMKPESLHKTESYWNPQLL